MTTESTTTVAGDFTAAVTAIRLERTNSGPVFVQGDLVTERGTRYPLSLSHEDWDALETALTAYSRAVVMRVTAAVWHAPDGDKVLDPREVSLVVRSGGGSFIAAVDALDGASS